MAARLTAFLVSAIVAVTFVAGLIVGAQREDDGGPADLIIHNAHVYLGASTDAAEAVAIRDGKIVRVGSNKEIDRLRRRQTLDAAGGSVVAGLNDAGVSLFDTDPDLTRDQRLTSLRTAITAAHGLGLTSVQTTASGADDLSLLVDLRKEKALKLRVLVALAATLPVTDESMTALETLRKQVADEANAAELPAMLKVSAVKLTLGSTPDVRPTQKSRTSTRKPSTEQVAQLADALTRLDRQHWQIIVHVSTMSEATLAVDAFEQAFGAQAAAAIRTRRHRLELSTPLDAALTARLNTLELIPSVPAAVAAALIAAPAVQPVADATADADAPAPVIAPATALASTTPAATATAVAATAPRSTTAPAATSDAPAAITAAASASSPLAALAELLITSPLTVLRSDTATIANPLTALAAATAAAEPVDAIAAILDAYTSRAAYASHEEAVKGLISKDAAADLVIFSTDLFAAPSSQPDPIVTATIVNGEVVFTRGTAAKPATTN